ncbi:MAG: TonB-dependent receptor [Chitinophagales bacterium]|nr:TonB-dependent receptor [Chitinophagales bacterium]
MRKLFFALSLVFVSVIGFAQPAGMGGGNRGGGGQMPTGRFYGKVIDSKSGKPIEYASVTLLQNKMDTATKKRKEVIVAGMLTKPNGEFSLDNVAVFGPSKLKITVIGFKEFTQNVSFDIKPGGDMSAMMNALDKDLGNIKIDLDEKILDNVTVSASTNPGLQLGIDRKVFNVDKNIVSAGGTAVDVMKNVPSINVDIDGNVSLRNNAPQIFVDGRPTTMQLDQIPADAIESVEVITNPSAKFDASGGTAGILNIVLKKNRKVGYNGSLRANIDSRARVGFGGDINVRQEKINVFVSANLMQRRSISKGNTERLSLVDDPDNMLYQKDRGIMNGQFGFGRAGFDYFINNRTTLSASVNFGRGKFTPSTISDLFVDTLSIPVQSSFTKRATYTNGEFRNLGTTIGLKHNFPKAGREWTADLTFNRRKNNNDNEVNTDSYETDQTTLIKAFKQRQIGNGTNKSLIFQSDFVNPLGENSKIEMGIRAAFNENVSTNAFYKDENGQLVLQPASQVNYESQDRVIAAYTTYSNRIKNFGYQLGLRAESSNYQGKLTKTNENFDIDFPISFFPSVFLNQKLKNNQELQLNYSRRVNRPNFWQLSPFTDSSDFLNLSKGNPGLNPEFTNSLELSYSKTFKNKDNILLSLYYKNTNDLITRYQIVQVEPVTGKDQLINTYINANSSYVTGLEIILKNKITKWWDLTSNFNLFTSKIDIADPAIPDQDQFASWFGKINNTFKLPKNFSLQLSGDYQSKTILPPGGSGGGGGGRGMGGMFGPSTSAQGYVRPVYGVDAAIRYEFLKNKQASLSVNINDIFRTRVSDVHSESPFFIQDVFRRRDPQVVRVNFSWRFGKFDMSLFKRKNMKSGGDGGGMEGMGM